MSFGSRVVPRGGFAKRDPAEARATLAQLDVLIERDFANSLAFVVIIGGDDAHAVLAGMWSTLDYRSSQPASKPCADVRKAAGKGCHPQRRIPPAHSPSRASRCPRSNSRRRSSRGLPAGDPESPADAWIRR